MSEFITAKFWTCNLLYKRRHHIFITPPVFPSHQHRLGLAKLWLLPNNHWWGETNRLVHASSYLSGVCSWNLGCLMEKPVGSMNAQHTRLSPDDRNQRENKLPVGANAAGESSQVLTWCFLMPSTHLLVSVPLYTWKWETLVLMVLDERLGENHFINIPWLLCHQFCTFQSSI